MVRRTARAGRFIYLSKTKIAQVITLVRLLDRRKEEVVYLAHDRPDHCRNSSRGDCRLGLFGRGFWVHRGIFYPYPVTPPPGHQDLLFFVEAALLWSGGVV